MIEYNKRNARLWSIMGIGPAIWSIGFADVVKERDNVALLTADLARYSGLMRMFSARPKMCYNVGIAEQNMIGIGAGMAIEGVQVFMTTYAPFITLRCADQVRHLMGNLNLNMKAIGSAAGLSGGFSGPSLHAINDLALMRSIPNMVVLCPSDTMEAVKMIESMAQISAPCYMRYAGTINLPMVYTEDYNFEIGKAVVLKRGSKVALVATGTNIVSNSIKAAEILKTDLNVDPTVVNMHTIKPLDKVCLDTLLKTHDLIVSVEEHNVIGGLGSAIAEYLCTTNKSYRQVMIGVQDCNYKMGSRPYMLEQAGLTAERIAERVKKALYV